MHSNAFLLMLFLLFQVGCSSSDSTPEDNTDDGGVTPPVVTNDVDFWLTTGNKSKLLEKQTDVLGFGTSANNYPTIEVKPGETFQDIDGFGFTLTGGSAEVINSLDASKKQALLQELFGTSESSISINYLRVSIGASDLNAAPFTYNDLADGETDLNLEQFSLEPDRAGVIAVLKDILKINPNIQILGSPWSPPVWMKDNGSFKGGELQAQYYGVYAQYFVKYIQQMKAEGITMDAITIQNEPLHDGNNPSLYMPAADQAEFIKNHLGPAFETAGIQTKIIIWDHNCDNPQYPITVLNDADANKYIDGSAFHLYSGDIKALSTVHNAFPNKNLYFTEQYTPSDGSFPGDLKWHLKNVIIGATRNWSRNALEWNLANNSEFGPHTDGGCTTCKGGLTISNSGNITRNVGYYIVGHASKFVPSGSKRIASNIAGNLQNVAFLTPDGKQVLIVVNDSEKAEFFNIKVNGKWVTSFIDGGAVATYIWK
ncbi:glycoside hydrolase family 30 protein [Tamlana sp. I1]|uniref:glycoside hydrolase family 30 protein n=1 Tax=Tamlana sp. I1 TaxID=2762061 RepID=UPI001E5F38A7|nr:glycoside hydrolase family 30 beta sandwich domain-containing protein [Tamlana sp. I1]